MSRFKEVSLNASLVVLSLVVSLALVELILRFAYPRYEYAADADYQDSALRIWKRQPDQVEERRHPDTGRAHVVRHNNLALRHDRDITEAELGKRTVIGVFGDSFTENLRLPAAHGLVEVLDYLLNLHGDRFTVLNFGVDGYGTDQDFLYYREWTRTRRLDHVVYVLCANDLGDLQDNGLFSVNEDGDLQRNAVSAVSPWVRFISRFHTTYLLFDVVLRIKGNDEPATLRLIRRQNNSMRDEQRERREQDLPRLVHDLEGKLSPGQAAALTAEERAVLHRSSLLFQGVLDAWRREVEQSDARFSIALLPRLEEQGFRTIIPPQRDIVDLYQAAGTWMPGYEFAKIRFANDGHWNELGNLIAALALYRHLENRFGLEKVSDRELRRAVYKYYKAIDSGWMPDEQWASRTTVTRAESDSIRRRYTAAAAGGVRG